MSLLTYQDARPWAKGIKALWNLPQKAWVDAEANQSWHEMYFPYMDVAIDKQVIDLSKGTK